MQKQKKNCELMELIKKIEKIYSQPVEDMKEES